jgi:proteic killer suppression protein
LESYIVNVSTDAEKDLKKIPKNLVVKLALWIKQVNNEGITQVRKMKGYHDEPLKGDRKGQRSIRLNKAYRAIYTEYDEGRIDLNYIEIDEVNKHEY